MEDIPEKVLKRILGDKIGKNKTNICNRCGNETTKLFRKNNENICLECKRQHNIDKYDKGHTPREFQL